jgi:hypothetical protein
MPYYRVMLHGTGIRLDDPAGQCKAIGFYTTRIVRATNDEDASARATDVVTRQWAEPEYARSNVGSAPRLSIESVMKSSLLERLRFRGTGHTFYRGDESAA